MNIENRREKVRARWWSKETGNWHLGISAIIGTVEVKINKNVQRVWKKLRLKNKQKKQKRVTLTLNTDVKQSRKVR